MQKPLSSTLINVCIIPSDEVGENCVSISRSLESDSTMFVLGNGKFAHITAFMARFANDHIPEVIETVERLLKLTSEFRCQHSGYFMTEGRYLEVSYRRTTELMSLHEQLVQQLAPLRINPGNPYEEGYFTPYTAEQRRNAEETGYDLARSLYRPHATLTRYKEGMIPEEFPAFAKSALSFNVSRVCVYEADDNGAVFKLLKEAAI
jgi:2'-5' RNA ligase